MTPHLRDTVGERAAIWMAALLAYAVLIGGTSLGEVHPALRTVNAVIGAGLVLWYALRPGPTDRIDLLALAATILLCAAAALSAVPRQSLDSAVGALGLLAAFHHGRRVFESDRSRKLLLASLMALSAVLTVVTAVRWITPYLEWWSLTDWTVMPPLELRLNAQPWGHRHDLALLVVMLYPSWWVDSWMRRARRIAAVPLGLLGLAIVVLDGSRTLAIALVVATALVLIPVIAARSTRVKVSALGAAAFVAVGVIVGLGPVLERLTDARTLGARAGMWEFSVEAWLTAPLAGIGPGSFPWALQRTDYFDTAVWAPRHPDSLVFQLLPEMGILGLIAVACAVVALAPALARSPLHAARWPLLVFAIAGIGANPSDFGFLLAVAIAWAVLLVPFHAGAHRDYRAAVRPSIARAAIVPSLLVIGIAYAATVVSGFQYEAARAAVARNDLQSAERHLRVAARLDPGMGLYWRQLGTARLLKGETDASIRALRTATRINPSDDLAWRTLALAQRSRGDIEAVDALDAALDAQRSDVTNLLLSVAWSEPGDADSATEELVLGWPTLVAAPGWAEAIDIEPVDAVAGAIDRWERGERAPFPIRNQPLLLVAWADERALEDRAIEASGLGDALGRAYIAITRCDADGSRAHEAVSARGMRHAEYWALAIKLATGSGSDVDRAVRAYRISTGSLPPAPSGFLNPLNENTSAGFSADAWGYRRQPIDWPLPTELRLPSPSAGVGRWLWGPSPALPGATSCG